MANEPPESRPHQPPDSTHNSAESKGFIARLAQRSTGLTPSTATPRDDSDQSLWRTAGMGVQVVATTIVFAGIGYVLDREFGWFPWATLVMAMIGMIGGLYLLIKEALKLTR